MDFALSDEHRMLRDSAAGFLDANVDLSPLLQPGATAAAIDSTTLWRGISNLGWAGMVIPEAYGGLGMSHVDLLMILEQAGRTLAPLPLFGTLAGTWCLVRGGSEAQKLRWLPEVAAGTCRMALAIGETDRTGKISEKVSVSGAGTAPRLSGTCTLVVDAGQADQIVVAAAGALYLVSCTAPGLAITPLDWRDITRQVCEVTLDAVPAERLEQGVDQVWPAVRERLLFVLAAESVGGLQHVLDATLAYAKERVAFGRPIGAYQAIKHQLADMKAAMECASVASLYAGWALDQAPDLAPAAVRMAHSYASEAYCDAAFRSIQIFGAIGFTWEMRNHLYLKRARANAALLGLPATQRADLFAILERRHRDGNWLR
ncbi:MAG: acyl-CoA dehydrogenase family protein [Pseudomonadota bacterium]